LATYGYTILSVGTPKISTVIAILKGEDITEEICILKNLSRALNPSKDPWSFKLVTVARLQQFANFIFASVMTSDKRNYLLTWDKKCSLLHK